ncbi:response regulator [Colwellia sp. MSW7]|uniref:Response regulator n=1 Tax=Colwellia maritima TaxID=2912588 RepID=A0ABS9X499_9GAMM|nr:response regulator [Colwellia maritima]MCI2285074.1 response regulator [Colwellia maritima]
MNILVVDDKRSVRDYISKLLTPLGYIVSTAVNGLDGFEKAQQNPFNLYIIDHLMPLMNGVTLSKNLKQTPFCAQTPILFMTTTDKASVENLPEVNLFNHILTKPLDEAEFLSSVQFLLNNVSSKLALSNSMSS